MSDGIKGISLRDAYAFAAENGFADEVAKIRTMNIKWNRSYTSSVRRGFIIRLLKENDLLDKFIEKHWPTGNTEIGHKRIRRVLNLAFEYENYLEGETIDEEDDLQSEESYLEFALEAHLRDFLVKDLSRVEPGLKLYESEGRLGVEYPVDGGRIDILAIDSEGRNVVIELKLSQGRNRALVQILYYMGWVDANLGSKPCRGIVIASEISNELRIAVSRAPDVSLYRYNMSFSVEPALG